MWLLELIADRIAIFRLRRENAALRREKELLLAEMRIKDAAYARWEAEQREMQAAEVLAPDMPESVDK
jgi:KaiC/GvpD/RAD55 family RecA-like ATPase